MVTSRARRAPILKAASGGNAVTSPARTFTIIDTTQPVLSIPDDQMVECDGSMNIADFQASICDETAAAFDG